MVLIIEDIAILLIFFLISTVVIIVAHILVQNFFLEQLNKDISNKLKTFGATFGKRKSSEREPSPLEIGLGFLQTMVDMKAQGLSLKDIVKEATSIGVSSAVESLTPETEGS